VARRTSSGRGSALRISGSETWGTAIGCDVKTNASGDVFVFRPATGNRRTLVAKSTNEGSSWSSAVMINDQSWLNDPFNQWMTVDETTGA